MKLDLTDPQTKTDLIVVQQPRISAESLPQQTWRKGTKGKNKKSKNRDKRILKTKCDASV